MTRNTCGRGNLLLGTLQGESWYVWLTQLSLKQTPLGPNLTVRFRKVSTLREFSLPYTWPSKLKPGFPYSEQWSHDGPVASLLAAHTNWHILLIQRCTFHQIVAIFRSAINLREHPVSVSNFWDGSSSRFGAPFGQGFAYAFMFVNTYIFILSTQFCPDEIQDSEKSASCPV